jgi:quercetin dioxygenase-like cupin family protein
MSTNTSYLFANDLLQEVEIPKNGILSRTIYADDQVKVIIFGFDTGQELSKHTASSSAMLHIIKGKARLTLGTDAMEVSDGAWARMEPKLEHAIFALSPVVMVLYILSK